MRKSLNEVAAVIAHMKNDSFNYELLEAIKVHAIALRGLYLRQDSNRNVTSALFVQRLKNLLLERVHITENDKLAELLTDKKDTILRTKEEIPTPVRLKGDLFIYVGDVNNQNPYTEAEFTELKLISYNRFTAKIPRYIYIEKRIYIVHANVARITVHLVPEDPREVNKVKDCGCVFDEDEDVFVDTQDMYLFILTELQKIYNINPVKDRETEINKL